VGGGSQSIVDTADYDANGQLQQLLVPV
jgi:hypothetical protein